MFVILSSTAPHSMLLTKGVFVAPFQRYRFVFVDRIESGPPSHFVYRTGSLLFCYANILTINQRAGRVSVRILPADPE